jgi:acyl-CoA reductase-like NAD-dependent aldehyde dehydrogenase
MLTGAFKSNCSMNCIAPKVLVLPSEAVWPQRPQFLTALRQSLAQTPQPPPFYPGAHQRYAAFEKEYPDAEKIEAPPSQASGCGLEVAEYSSQGQDIKILPSLLVDVGTIGEAGCRTYALQTEAFAPVLAIATVACSDPKEFPVAAARAVNEHVFGNLGCNVIYPDKRDETLEAMVRTLNYGFVSVNHWVALMYANPLGVWGGAPGSYKPSAPSSGLGFLGNLARVPRLLRGVSFAAFDNKDIVMDKPMPYLLADVLTVVIAKKPWAVLRILGILLRGMCGIVCAAVQRKRQ